MSSHTFTIVLSTHELTSELEDALFEAGCDDATLYQSGGGVFLEFDREAPSRREAVLSALQQIRDSNVVSILRVIADDLVNAAQIADRLVRTRESVRLLINGERGPGGFPAPAQHVGKRPLWSWGEVVAWLAANEIDDAKPDDAMAVIEAVNNALGLARAESSLTDSAVRQVSTLLGDRLSKAVESAGRRAATKSTKRGR